MHMRILSSAVPYAPPWSGGGPKGDKEEEGAARANRSNAILPSRPKLNLRQNWLACLLASLLVCFGWFADLLVLLACFTCLLACKLASIAVVVAHRHAALLLPMLQAVCPLLPCDFVGPTYSHIHTCICEFCQVLCPMHPPGAEQQQGGEGGDGRDTPINKSFKHGLNLSGS